MLQKISGKFRALRSLLFQMDAFENWREVWSEYSKGQEMPHFKLRNGMTLHHQNSDDPIFLYREIFADKIYTDPHFYSPQSNHTVVDLGANIGFFAIHLEALAPGISVHCFEPAESTRKTLEQNVKTNHLEPHIHIYPYGVFDKNTTLELQAAELTGHRSVFASEFTSKQGPEKIECLRLDSALNKASVTHVDLLKVDVEGSEIEIFEGAPKDVWKQIDRVILEYHDLIRPGCKERVLKVLKKHGFDKIHDIPTSPKGDIGLLRAHKL